MSELVRHSSIHLGRFFGTKTLAAPAKLKYKSHAFDPYDEEPPDHGREEVFASLKPWTDGLEADVANQLDALTRELVSLLLSLQSVPNAFIDSLEDGIDHAALEAFLGSDENEPRSDRL